MFLDRTLRVPSRNEKRLVMDSNANHRTSLATTTSFYRDIFSLFISVINQKVRWCDNHGELRYLPVQVPPCPICKRSFATWRRCVSCSFFLRLRQCFLLKSWDTVRLVRDLITTSSAVHYKSLLLEDTRYCTKCERCNPLNRVCR